MTRQTISGGGVRARFISSNRTIQISDFYHTKIVAQIDSELQLSVNVGLLLPLLKTYVAVCTCTRKVNLF